MFEHKLADLRDRRARFRGLLYDALQERAAVIQSHLAHHEVHYRARAKLDYWIDRSGLDGWLLGFFVASLLVVVCYIVFLTFPSVPAPQFRALLTPLAAYEFDYRITILTSLFVVVGLSFWMSLYKRFQWSSLGLNLLLVGWSVEFGLLMHVFFDWAFVTGFRQVPLSARLTSLALYSAATVVCAHAVLLGRLNATQAMVMSTAQCICFAVITGFQRYFNVIEPGGAVSVWIFGGVFGLTASVVYALDGEHHKPDKVGHSRQQNKHYNEEFKGEERKRERTKEAFFSLSVFFVSQQTAVILVATPIVRPTLPGLGRRCCGSCGPPLTRRLRPFPPSSESWPTPFPPSSFPPSRKRMCACVCLFLMFSLLVAPSVCRIGSLGVTLFGPFSTPRLREA